MVRAICSAVFGVVLVASGGCGFRTPYTFRVTDVETKRPVEGAKVWIDEKHPFLYEYVSSRRGTTNAAGIAVIDADEGRIGGYGFRAVGYARTRDARVLPGRLKADAVNEFLVFRPVTLMITVPVGYRGPVLIHPAKDVASPAREKRDLEETMVDPGVAIVRPRDPVFDEEYDPPGRIRARFASGEAMPVEGDPTGDEVRASLWYLFTYGSKWEGKDVEIYFVGSNEECRAFGSTLKLRGPISAADEGSLRASVDAARSEYFRGGGR